ncbi:LysR family transcriptional regulator [Nonomuraea sp. NPDC046570]|uniref:LysR family transcriptional regulator n=1 Tax=Nonomuraea sp. NPDC046570 TaxID=3155255 RepID=UPI00340E30E8
MDRLKDVRCFAVVARRLSFSAAAAEMGLSQPAVSQAVARLEGSLGLRLFERSSREVRLTGAGKALLGHARALLDAATAFEAEGARLARPAIRLAYPPIVGSLAARIARRLSTRGRGTAVELRAAGRAAAVDLLTGGEVSAAILGVPAPAAFTTAARFHVTLDRLAVPAGDRLARAVTPEELRGREVLMPRNRPAGGAWELLAARVPGRQRIVADDLDDFAPALDLVAAGAGVLPVPHLLARTVRRDDVRFVPLDGGDLRLSYGLAWPRDGGTPELLELVQAVQEALWTR